MRNSALVASATLALLLVPGVSTAQEPHWLFEVPLNLQSLNQEVESVHVDCRTFDHAAQDIYQTPVGMGKSAPIYPDGQGNVSSVASVPVTASDENEPGMATHYVCQLRLDLLTGPQFTGPPNDNPGTSIGRQPKSGTQLVSEVAGSLP